MYKTIQLPNELAQFANPNELHNYHVPDLLIEAIAQQENNLAYRFLVVSGPSGVGKSSILSILRTKQIGNLNWRVIRRLTTRPRRLHDSEIELGFITHDEFSQLESNGALLYSEFYSGNRAKYGITMDDLIGTIQENGANTVFVIVGTLALSQILPQCGYIYIMPPSLAELRHRIAKCGKPDTQGLFMYDVKEMNALISSRGSAFIKSCAVSIVVNENNLETECAYKISSFAKYGIRYSDLASNLVIEVKAYATA